MIFMGVLDVVRLFGGLALFLFGMSFMSDGLEKLSGGKMESFLGKMTSSVPKGMFFGLLVTALIQSSSATTVMMVGFVNAGMMRLTQAVGVIMGANIGTTVTAQILRMGDISSDNLVLQLLKPSALAPMICVVGVVFFMIARNGKRRIIGQILIGFGVLFFGMSTMETAVAPLKNIPTFTQFFTAFSNPLLGVLIGAALTAVIQSSSASVGILQALSSTGSIPFSAAAPIILGQNIGTCVTTLISSINANRNARRAAFIHLYFNLIGTVVFLVGLYSIHYFFPFSLWDEPVNRGVIANFHTLFNITSAILLLPFSRLLVRLAEMTLKDKGDEDEDYAKMLDERFLSLPSVALERAHETTMQMALLAQKNYTSAAALCVSFDSKEMERLVSREDIIDKLESRLGRYLVSLTEHNLNPSESTRQANLLRTLSDFERIGDYSVNLVEEAQKRAETNISFSSAGFEELKRLLDAVDEIINLTVDMYSRSDVKAAQGVEPLEEVIDTLTDLCKTNHINRLRQGECLSEAGAFFVETLIHLERIADHCSNIAVSVIQSYGAENHDFDAHEYRRRMHTDKAGPEYTRLFDHYYKKYMEE